MITWLPRESRFLDARTLALVRLDLAELEEELHQTREFLNEHGATCPLCKGRRTEGG